jgi:hypothetical protein
VVINVVAVTWSLFMIVWLTLPLYLPVTSLTMNYASAVYVAVIGVSTVNWFVYSRNKFREPIAMYEGDGELNGAAPGL